MSTKKIQFPVSFGVVHVNEEGEEEWERFSYETFEDFMECEDPDKGKDRLEDLLKIKTFRGALRAIFKKASMQETFEKAPGVKGDNTDLYLSHKITIGAWTNGVRRHLSRQDQEDMEWVAIVQLYKIRAYYQDGGIYKILLYTKEIPEVEVAENFFGRVAKAWKILVNG
jgi:hypothetical protein